MEPPVFLTLDQVLYIHNEQIRRFGGSSGIRDQGLLQSALAMPSARFDGRFLHQNLHEMAAAYFFHLILNHPFIDGNKRVGAMTADIFLELNGFFIPSSKETEFEKLAFQCAGGKTEKHQIADFFRENSRKTQG